MGLMRDIHHKQTAILENRRRIALESRLLKQRLQHQLASPPALAASFGLGFMLSMLRPRKKKDATPKSKTHKQANPWLRLLLRDAIVPLALNMLHTSANKNEQQSTQDTAGIDV